jgi:hypothetical protein
MLEVQLMPYKMTSFDVVGLGTVAGVHILALTAGEEVEAAAAPLGSIVNPSNPPRTTTVNGAELRTNLRIASPPLIRSSSWCWRLQPKPDW